MMTVAAQDAKARFDALLDQVAAGVAVTITREGEPVARLVPAAPPVRADAQAVIAALKAFRAGNRLDGLDALALIREGRR
jgi:prevent-host-death family protein